METDITDKSESDADIDLDQPRIAIKNESSYLIISFCEEGWSILVEKGRVLYRSPKRYFAKRGVISDVIFSRKRNFYLIGTTFGIYVKNIDKDHPRLLIERRNETRMYLRSDKNNKLIFWSRTLIYTFDVRFGKIVHKLRPRELNPVTLDSPDENRILDFSIFGPRNRLGTAIDHNGDIWVINLERAWGRSCLRNKVPLLYKLTRRSDSNALCCGCPSGRFAFYCLNESYSPLVLLGYRIEGKSLVRCWTFEPKQTSSSMLSSLDSFYSSEGDIVLALNQERLASVIVVAVKSLDSKLDSYRKFSGWRAEFLQRTAWRVFSNTNKIDGQYYYFKSNSMGSFISRIEVQVN